ncbi:MAG: HlyD family efflux transporter periplasmic adaptor subunit [Paraburkholderia sp.]|uniref:efflux RND transporter periplasmic adaptor subunit n=1 Tax=Paraburkholderia sp. TaxID=1926495 RepID=UPI0012160908|nr:efflux RND transporter periplasmic adaptor subunit [Paraburkholderia sp.]TAL99035.1 MAG: HlyD family efflux transporter periplasmic adaptor subunit [Paraburkholderia sp.]
MNSARLFILAAAVITSSVAGHRAFAEDVVTMPAVQKRVVATISATAHVQAASNTVLSAPVAGIVSGLRVLPGETVRPGQTVAHLTGPTVSTDSARLAADLESARIRVSAATQAAAIEQQKLDEQLSTRDAVVRMRAELDTARQQLAAAQSAIRSYTRSIAIGVPEPGVVTAVNAADGQYVSAGQALVTVAPSRGLHVVANFYGNDASLVTGGMQGVFLAEGADAPINVVVQRVSWSVTAPGQLEVWLNAAPGRALVTGTVGTVSLTTSDDKRLAIPSTALVLDGGQWWVLVRDKSGNHRRRVVPGLSDRGWTSIVQGLSQDERVVVQDAYLLFHQDFAVRYQQAD